MTMLDARAQHLLKTLVERYIAEGQPVGSRALSRQSGLELSSRPGRGTTARLIVPIAAPVHPAREAATS